MAYIWLWLIFIDLPLALLRILIALVGPIAVAIALPFSREKDYSGKPQYPGWKMVRLPRLFYPWDNPDYGTMGNHGYGISKAYNPVFYRNPSGLWSQWYWLAIRNPANGLREMSLFSCSQNECDFVRFNGKPIIDNGIYGRQLVWARKGRRLFTGYYAMIPYCPWFDLELRVGFKLLPTEPTRRRKVGITLIVNPFKILK